MARYEPVAELRSFSPYHRPGEDLRLDPPDMEGVLARWMEREARALIVVTEELVIQWANPAAEELVRQHSALRRQNGGLRGRSACIDGRLRTFVRKATATPSTTCLVGHASDENLILMALRLEPPWGRLVGLTLRSARDKAEVRLTDPALAFGLTRAESRVASSLLGGRTAEQTAGELRVSIETVRTHIKRCYGKLGVSSREAFFCKLAPYIVTLV